MGVDILGIVRHKMTAKEILSLPERIDSWSEMKELKKDNKHMLNKTAKWDCKNEMTEEALLLLWKCLETNEPQPKDLYGFDYSIECFIGWINVFRNTLVINHFPEHKYGNIDLPETANRIIKINRKIAREMGSEEIIYCPDSAYPTSIIEECAMEGKSLDEIKKLGIAKFGQPPKGINEGRKYMFFIDNLNEEIGEITERNEYEEYWKYNRETGRYELKKEDSI